MAFCISKNLVNDFLAKLKSGEISPEKLVDMTSSQRNALFAETLGEANAQKVNALFESKLLLKSQQKGIVNWAKKVTGMTPEAKRDLVSRVERMEEILTPESADVFLNDLANQRLGVNVTQREAGNIAALAKDVKENREAMDEGGDRMDYGRARVAFEDYVSNLKDDAKAKKLIEFVKPENYLEGISNVSGFLKSMKATFDMSAIFRQGLKTMWTQPDIWFKNTKKSFKDVVDVFGGKDVMKEVRADIVSRPNSLSGLYKRERLAVGVKEEAFPTSAPEKIPIAGKAFKASETAFTAFQFRNRADVFDRLVQVAEKTDADIQGLGKFVNSLTGRGSLGTFEPSADVFNNLFFSARFVRSSFDGLTGFQFNRKLGKFSRKQGAKATVNIILGTAAILATAKTFDKDSVEEDATSTDYGQIKSGNTRFDVSGGMRSIVVLAERLRRGEVKSSTTGTARKLNERGSFMGKKKSDLIIDFAQGKVSPFVSAVKMLVDQETYFGDQLTPGNFAFEVLTPIMISNTKELLEDPRSANVVVASLADFFGIGTNTWGPEVKWHNKTTKEMIQFREEKGEKKFKQANKDYNNLYVEWLKRAKKDGKFKGASNEDKIKILQKQRRTFKKQIFRKFHFSPKREKAKKIPEIK